MKTTSSSLTEPVSGHFDAIWRWTNGDAVFPTALFAVFSGGCELTVTLRGNVTYWFTDVAELQEELKVHRTG